MSSHASQLYAFNDFHLDVGETVLLREGKHVAITPKAFHLLSILVENHGTLVKKEKLISEIWSDSIVEEGNLAFTARLLRQALGDNARSPTYIETIPRRGYRFIADVSKPTPAIEKEPVAHVTNAEKKFSRIELYRLALIIVTVSLAIFSWFAVDRYLVASSSAPILGAPFKAERLSSTGNAAQVVISPNGKLIAYTDQTGNGQWSIWLRQVSTAENIQIVAPADVMYGGLAFSHDNNSLFIARGEKRSKRLDIYRVNVFGGIPARLIQEAEGWISISPDDKKISFVRCKYTPADYCSLFVADIDGQNERRVITRPSPFRIADNQFSNDGRSIAFASGQSGTGSNEFGLFRVDLETGMDKPITPERFFNVKHLRWLSSGNELLFTARTHAQQKFSIWKVSVPTGVVAQLTRDDGNFSGLSLDGDGQNLVATKVDNDFTIYLEPLADRTTRRSLALGASSVFTPDGRVVYESKDLDIWIVDADGNNKRQLTNDPSCDIKPVVTADGKSVIFSSNRSGVNHLWRMNIDGSDQKQITQAEGGYAEFVTSDGRWVYYRTWINSALRKVNTESGLEVELTKITGSEYAFSADGLFVASFIRAEDNSGRLDAAIRDLADQSLVRVVSDVGDDKAEPIHLEWSPDGRALIAVIRRAGEYELWRHDVSANRRTLMAKLGSEPLKRVSLAPDGRSIAAVRGSWLHDAFLITGLRY